MKRAIEEQHVKAGALRIYSQKVHIWFLQDVKGLEHLVVSKSFLL